MSETTLDQEGGAGGYARPSPGYLHTHTPNSTPTRRREWLLDEIRAAPDGIPVRDLRCRLQATFGVHRNTAGSDLDAIYGLRGILAPRPGWLAWRDAT